MAGGGVRIPATTVKPRFYVATHHTAKNRRALSSWGTLAEAQDAIRRLREQAIRFPHSYKSDLNSVTCITETGPGGHTNHPPIPLNTDWDEGVTPP